MTGNRTHELRRFALWALLVVGLASIASSLWLGMRARERRAEADARYERGVRLVEGAEAVLLDLDDVMGAEISSDLAGRIDEVTGVLPEARKGLSDAVAVLESVAPQLEERHAEAARALVSSAKARLRMIGAGERALEANLKASAAIGPARDAWKDVLEGERLADYAVAAYNKHTKDSVQEASRTAVSAGKRFVSAREGFRRAEKVFPQADMGPFVRYCDGKIELLELSRRIDAAWLAGQVADANKLLDRYNKKEKELVGAAGKLPSSETAPLADAFERVAGADSRAYYEARRAASRADALVERLTVIGK